METVLPDIPVMYALSENGPMGSPEAFKKVEGALGRKLKGRRFYGVMDATGVYKSCVAITEGDDPTKLGLETDVISGGTYLRGKINDWEKHIMEIKPAFDKLVQQAGDRIDSSRPHIEYTPLP